MNDKIKKSVKYIGVTSLIGLISFLSTIFVTQKSFSDWKENIYHKEQETQNLNINTISSKLLFFKESLIRIESNQREIIKHITGGVKK